MLYSLVMVLISIPVSFFFIENLLSEEVDEALGFRMAQFQRHIKSFENLEDIHTDIMVMNRLITDMGLVSTEDLSVHNSYKTVIRFDSLENDESPFRELSTVIPIQGINYLVNDTDVARGQRRTGFNTSGSAGFTGGITHHWITVIESFHVQKIMETFL